MTTALGAWGLPRSKGPFTAKALALAGQITQLGAGGVPIKRYLVPGKTLSANSFPAVSDTWLGTFVEDPNSSINLALYESWTVGFNDVRTVTLVQLTTDSWALSFLDAGQAQVVNVTVKAGTDTWTTTFNESSSLAISLPVTDTYTVSFTDSSAVVVNVQQQNLTETWTTTFDDAALQTNVAGVAILTGDSWLVVFLDAGARSDAPLPPPPAAPLDSVLLRMGDSPVTLMRMQ
jgi:hypothetical protein